eukprot:2638506-Rhodomonas_salina.1
MEIGLAPSLAEAIAICSAQSWSTVLCAEPWSIAATTGMQSETMMKSLPLALVAAAGVKATAADIS